ncbi:hypothetical protein CPB86DRAFT_811930 [Serendipita vermifera]|nr:hypothetical protein CPB86DRAFT_811930 [Serendipita vermifera]
MAEAPSQSVDSRSTTAEVSSSSLLTSLLTSSTSVTESSASAASEKNAPRLSPTTTLSGSESKPTEGSAPSRSNATDIETLTTTVVLMFTSEVDTAFPTSTSESIRFEAITISTDPSSADGESITISGSDEGTAGPRPEEDNTLLLAISTSTVSQDISRLQPVPPPQSSSSHSESLSNDNTFEVDSAPPSSAAKPSSLDRETSTAHSTTTGILPLFTEPRTFTSDGTVFQISSFLSVYETTLEDGTSVTESVLYETRIPIPTAQSNGQDNIASEGRERPTLPGIYEPVTSPPVSFFKKPAAAAGVFIAIMLVLGSLVWMFFIIRRHRQAVAAAANQKRPIFAYGSTGISHRDRRSYLSEDSLDWPQRFGREELEEASGSATVAPSSQPSGSVAKEDRHLSPSPPSDNLPGRLIYPTSADLLPSLLPSVQSAQQTVAPLRLLSKSTSPPVSPQASPQPARNDHSSSRIATTRVGWGFEFNAYGLDDRTPAVSDSFPSTSRSVNPPPPVVTTNQRPNPRVSFISRNVHILPTRTALSPIPDASEPSMLLMRSPVHSRISRRSSTSDAEDPFCSSKFVVPFLAPVDGREDDESSLDNPFDDRASPSPTGSVSYTQEHYPLFQEAMFGRQLSLRINDSITKGPLHIDPARQTTIRSGSAPVVGNRDDPTTPLSREYPGQKVVDQPRNRRSESISSGQTSIVNNTSSVESNDLFFTPRLASPRSPVQDKYNPIVGTR